MMPPALQPQPEILTLEQYEALPENRRVEIFDSVAYDMASPSQTYYYKNAGVREYWIVDPRRKTVTVNYFEGDIISVQYPFDSIIKVNIYDDLLINFSEIADLLNI